MMPTAFVPDLPEAIHWHVVQRGLGMIPDPQRGEPWLSVDAIAFVINRQPQTILNWLTSRRKAGLPIPMKHAAGCYYRLTEFVETVFDGRTPRGKGSR